MNLDELQSVRDRERQTDKLQQLRESFYADAGEFIQQLRTERDRAAERAADPFDAPEISRLTDEIDTAEQTVEAIYEKRVGKIVKAASFAAADLPAEADGLTAEEQELFDTLVADIKHNRQRVLDVLTGSDTTPLSDPANTGSPPAESARASQADGSEPIADSPDVTAPPEKSATEGSAADLMRAASDAEPNETTDTAARGSGQQSPDQIEQSRDGVDPSESVTIDTELADSSGTTRPDDDHRSVEKSAEPPVRNDGGTAAEDSEHGAVQMSGPIDVVRQTVRVTEDVDTFVGFDDREYDLDKHDVVTLPETNVGPLVEQGVVERLDGV